LIICALKRSVQCRDDDKERTKRVFDTWREGRMEYRSPVSVTTVEEQKFDTRRQKPVVYHKTEGERKEREERDKGVMKKGLSV
jgi:hypothetical protein